VVVPPIRDFTETRDVISISPFFTHSSISSVDSPTHCDTVFFMPPIPETPDRPRKRLRNDPGRALGTIRLHVIQAKLDGRALAELFALADAHAGTVCARPDDADVVVTAIRMRQRLERHLDWALAVRSLRPSSAIRRR
jgi:hypothetical protein